MASHVAFALWWFFSFLLETTSETPERDEADPLTVRCLPFLFVTTGSSAKDAMC